MPPRPSPGSPVPRPTCVEGDVEAPSLEVPDGEGHQAAALGPVGGVGQLAVPLDLAVGHVFGSLELVVSFPEGSEAGGRVVRPSE